MKKLLNKTIKKILLDKNNQEYIVFDTNEGRIGYIALGDCCSETYFAEIIGASNIIKSKINNIEELELGLAEGTRQDEDKIYGIKIRSNKGVCLIIFRNSSNGYYGGRVEEINKVDDKIEFIEIKSDYYIAD